MPMGLVSDEDLEKEMAINGIENTLSNGVVIPEVLPMPEKGRNNGDMNVPPALRNVIAQDALENGRRSAVELAASFGISPSSASAYANGATSTASYNQPKPSLLNHVNKTRERIAKKAQKRLGWALEGITEEKLSEASLKTVASVAKDMAVIIKQMEPETEQGDKHTNVQVVLYAPPVVQVNEFPRVQAKE